MYFFVLRRWDKDTRDSVSVPALPPSSASFPPWTQQAEKGFGFRISDSVIAVKEHWTFCHVFGFCYYYVYLWAIEIAPLPWFVNTCVCTVLLWALDTGKETYIVFMRILKKAMLKKSAHVFLNVPTFLSKCKPFWKSINYCCTLLLWWQNNRKYEAQSVFAERGGQKSQNERVLTPGRTLPHWDPCTHVVR